MAVPQDALPLRRELGRKGNMVRIRRNISVDGRWFCGTVITVPYGFMRKWLTAFLLYSMKVLVAILHILKDNREVNFGPGPSQGGASL